MTSASHYIGRFAPSPTGPLHFGSLIAASASYLDAKSHNGQWLLRMEDIDKPREQPGAADAILRALEQFGFEWQGPVVRQSDRYDYYQAALQLLQQQDLAYGCACSRRQINAVARPGIDGPVYPGNCRNGLSAGQSARAWRLRVDSQPVRFTDRIQGEICHDLAAIVGDFVIKRADGLFAYQLAVVVDDAEQGITDVVRGADLLDSTTRQIFLQQQLGYASPRYAHIPVAATIDGRKLSKQNYAKAIDPQQAGPQLTAALQFLGLPVTQDLARQPLPAIWQWALTHWRLECIGRQRLIKLSADDRRSIPL